MIVTLGRFVINQGQRIINLCVCECVCVRGRGRRNVSREKGERICCVSYFFPVNGVRFDIAVSLYDYVIGGSHGTIYC